MEQNDLKERVSKYLSALLEDRSNLTEVGKNIRQLILAEDLPAALTDEILSAYAAMSADDMPIHVAVRSSATAEDLPEASFAGQLDSFLNIEGQDALLDAVRRCYASLYTDRAIIYREVHGFDHLSVALSVGVQRMVRSDLAGSGVMFSIDTETGFPQTVLISAAFGFGETVVQGLVDPDEYMAFKPFLADEALVPIIEKRLGKKSQKMISDISGLGSQLIDTPEDERQRFVLTDTEILTLARWATATEAHYGQAMDMEWAKDGITGELFLVQARPETVHSRREAGVLKSYTLTEKKSPLIIGLAIGDTIAVGPVCRLSSPAEIEHFRPGSVLVTATTDPDWVPIMKKASAIVTDQGGRTSHAAIVSRELGLTAVVGTGDATSQLIENQMITVSCAQGDEGHVYDGQLSFDVAELDISHVPETNTKVMVNLANPAAAFRWWRLPSDGVGLARMEFIIANLIRVHPMALVHFDRVEDATARREIEQITLGYDSKPEYFVDRLSRGISRIASAHYPAPVIVRMSDFKTNEYAALLGGAPFEPAEENPMIGWRGASRYYSENYREGFALECRAIDHARRKMGFSNIIIMIPFCRTLDEADRVIDELARNGLERGQDGLEVYVMCEIPANVILAEQFAERFDGVSIGSNDLTQLTLGIDRDSHLLSGLFDERDPAVTASIATVLEKARKTGTKTGLCGQAPSDHPDFARFLVEHGIDSISVSPDSFLAVKNVIAAAEADKR
jgi:pyruvate,water dikinase